MSISPREDLSEQEHAALASRWQPIPGTQLSWRDWDEDEVAVYSHNLGHSYLLDANAWQVMSLLYHADSALALSTLVSELLLQCPPETPDHDVMQLLAAVLPELHRIGLAQPAA